jgi:hypothetical protein
MQSKKARYLLYRKSPDCSKQYKKAGVEDDCVTLVDRRKGNQNSPLSNYMATR